jgi:tagatose-6-phosphate ketose/aldose isomerase
VVFLGSGAYTPLAQEAALKLLELTAGQVVSFHDSPLGFRHGPKAVLNDETLAVVFASADPYTRRYDLDIVAELKRTLGDKDVLVVGAGGLPEHDILGLDGLDGVDDGLAAAAAIVPAQILALSFGLAAGRTPDNPFPNGDVNRVVKGVRIHEFGQ